MVSQSHPVVLYLSFFTVRVRPTKTFLSLMVLMVLSGDMHEFLWDAPDIDTCATESPSRTMWTGTNIVENGDFET